MVSREILMLVSKLALETARNAIAGALCLLPVAWLMRRTGLAFAAPTEPVFPSTQNLCRRLLESKKTSSGRWSFPDRGFRAQLLLATKCSCRVTPATE